MRKAAWLCLTLCAITAVWAVKPCVAQTPAPEKGTISGRVLTGTGEPLRRATVVLEEVRFADGSSETVGDTTTGDNGEFSFSDLSPARYRLEAEKSGYVAGRFPRTKALVRIVSGDAISDVTLRLVPTSVVSGNVLDGNGEPLSKAVVRLLQYKYYPGGRRLTVAREAISDERGEYRMGDLNPGRYYVVASYRSRISDTVCPPVYYPDVASFDDAMPIRLAPSDEAAIRFVLLAGKPVRVRGQVSGGVGNIRVSLIPRGGVPFAQLLTVETSDGSFEFKDVLPGDYTIRATSESTDEILEARKTITVGDRELDGVSVQLEKHGPYKRLWVSVDGSTHFGSTQDIVISLHRPFRSDDDSMIAAEDDLDAEGHEISTRGGNPIELPYRGPFIVSAENLPPGDFYIGRAELVEEYRGPTIPRTQHLVVQMNSDGASVEGVVLDSSDHPLPGATVVAVARRASNHLVDQTRITTTDQNGQFVLHGLANTAYGIYAWEDVTDGAYYDPDFLADYAGTALGMSLASGRHYAVTLHAASTEQE